MSDDRCELLCLDLDVAEAIRARRPDRPVLERAATRAAALADPTRLSLAAALAQADELCVCDLAWIAERPQNLVSHHLRALRTAGVVSSRPQGKMVLYAISEAGRALLAQVLAADAEVAQ